MARRLAAFFAHPDDDTYAVTGTAALHAEDGIKLTVVLATSGEAGRIADPTLATRETLGAVREAEDRASWAQFGVDVTHHFLRHPDYQLAGVPREELVAQLADLLVATTPDVVVTFGPEGVTGHEDHIAIGAATTEAFHAVRGRAGGGGLARLLYVALPQGRLERFGELLRERGMEPPDPAQPFIPRGVPDETIAVSVDCSSVYERKLEALRCHRTQGEMEDVPFDLWPSVLSEEHFVQAWPERAPGGPVLTDVFEGLRPA